MKPESFPFTACPHLRLICSIGIARLLHYYKPLRHSASPAHSSRTTSWCVPPHRQCFQCCCFYPLPFMPVPKPRWKRNGAHDAHFPLRRRPSPKLSWVGFRIARFEACSAFTGNRRNAIYVNLTVLTGQFLLISERV